MESRRPIEWTGATLRYIDQRLLPDRTVVIETADPKVIAESIRTLGIRGAPAIGIAAAYGVVLAAGSGEVRHCEEAIDLLAQTRPTAVNLFTALDRMRACLKQAVAEQRAVRGMLEQEAIAIHREDIEACRNIARFGASLITPQSSVLTHCHTGALATGGGGTALNVILEAFRRGHVEHVYVDETRPLLQGARLTAWELLEHGITPVLITDSTAGYLMKLRRVHAVIVGADRIAGNGDVANKIGTYSLAVLARAHDIPFYVAAPLSTIDPATPEGDSIRIEERPAEELTRLRGVTVAPAGVSAFAPAFDVTPSDLVTAIVTDAGIARPPYRQSLREIADVPSAGVRS